MATDKEALSIEVERHSDHAVIRPIGYLNALTGDQIDKVCEELIKEDLRYFILNFGKVSMVNTIGISILVGIIEKVLETEGLVYFTELGPTDRQIFEVLNLSSVAMIFESDEDARGHLHGDQEALRRAEEN